MKSLNPADGRSGESAPDIVISSTPPTVQKDSNGTAGKTTDTKVDSKTAGKKQGEIMHLSI